MKWNDRETEREIIKGLQGDTGRIGKCSGQKRKHIADVLCKENKKIVKKERGTGTVMWIFWGQFNQSEEMVYTYESGEGKGDIGLQKWGFLFWDVSRVLEICSD